MSNTIISKRCTKCKSNKLLFEFYIDARHTDGRQSQCKVCQSASKKKYRQTEKGKEAAKPIVARYLRSEKGKRSRIRYKAAHTIRIQARNAVSNAIRAGKLPHATVLQCTACDNPAEQYHHHHGYEEPFWLDVVPMCIDCHYDLLALRSCVSHFSPHKKLSSATR